jgi:hypothetical protein
LKGTKVPLFYLCYFFFNINWLDTFGTDYVQHLTCSEILSCSTSHSSCPVHLFAFIVHHLAVTFSGCGLVILFCEGGVTGSALCVCVRARAYIRTYVCVYVCTRVCVCVCVLEWTCCILAVIICLVKQNH